MASTIPVVDPQRIGWNPQETVNALATVAAAAVVDINALTSGEFALATTAPVDPDTAVAAVGTATTSARADHKHHIGVATTSVAGLESAADKTKLNSIQAGTVTLSAGTFTLSAGITITAGSKVFVSLNTPGGGTQGVKYKVPDAGLVVGAPGTGAFAVTAVDNAGSLVNTDVSTINYLIVG